MQLQLIPSGDSGILYTDSASIEANPAILMVDTGSESSLITRDFYKKIKSKLKKIDATFDMVTISGETATSGYEGSIRFDKSLTFIRDDYLIEGLEGYSATGVGFSGTLGYKIFSYHSFIIDIPHLEAKIFVKCPGSPNSSLNKYFPTGKNTTSVNSITSDGALYIPISLGNFDTYGLVDTGTVTSVISKQFAHKLGITGNDLARDPQVQYLYQPA